MSAGSAPPPTHPQPGGRWPAALPGVASCAHSGAFVMGAQHVGSGEQRAAAHSWQPSALIKMQDGREGRGFLG